MIIINIFALPLKYCKYHASESEGVCNLFDTLSNVLRRFSTCSVSSRPNSSVSNFNRLDKSEWIPVVEHLK